MSRAKGDIAESKAVAYLQTKGYTIVERNFYSRFGEVDIVAMKDSVYHFIEVKSALDFEQALNNITPTKLLRLTRTIDVYIKRNSSIKFYELDAIVITPDRLEHIQNITL
jgi:putative endonuclease